MDQPENSTRLKKRVGKAVVVHPPTMRALILRLNAEERAARSTPEQEYDEWHVPGGAVEPADDKSTEAAAIREVREETGIAVTIVKQLGDASWSAFYEGEPADFSADFYLAIVVEPTDEPPVPVLTTESDDAAWITEDELQTYATHGLMTEALTYISQGLKGLRNV